MPTLAEVLRTFGAPYLAEHRLSAQQTNAWRAIVSCRTAALGGHRIQCDTCSHTRAVYHSCRNRHCPQCQIKAKAAWTADRLAELLPVPYCHLVFTLPHALNSLAAFHPQWVFDTLFASAAQTLTAFAANPRWLGGNPAFTLVLHTWTQDLRCHLHVHALMACGALDAQGFWRTPARGRRFVFPVHALSRVFRAKFIDALDQARASDRLPNDPHASPELWARRRRQLLKHGWVVYAKSPMGGPEQVLEYLSRYTHRVAISNERIVGIDQHGVALRLRADTKGGKRVIRLPASVFIQRFLQHVLPRGYKRIRHYGILSPAHKKQALSAARIALQVPIPDTRAVESAHAFMLRVAKMDTLRCPCCPNGQLHHAEALPRQYLSFSRLTARGPP